jgi:hypothetical protein
VPKRRQDKGRLFRRADGVEMREVSGELFLIAPSNGAIHQLDHMASGAWRALAEPRSIDEIVALFHVAFPDTPKRQISKDIADLLAFLEDSCLIARTDTD